jgi:hypothetical protein
MLHVMAARNRLLICTGIALVVPPAADARAADAPAIGGEGGCEERECQDGGSEETHCERV